MTSELAVQRKITAAFIAAKFSMIALTPYVQQKTTTGGRQGIAQTPREPQRFHIIERVSTARSETHVPGGLQNEQEFTLLGNWDAVVEVHDRFTLEGNDWEVIAIDHNNGYERRAAVRRYGK